jgi:hypothetical protein
MKTIAQWIGLLGIACGGASSNMPAGSMSAGPMPAGGDWTGVYYSDWGRLEMQRTGDTVVGEFRSDTKKGRISGTVNGRLLTFTFTQNDETIPGRARMFQGSGQFRYYIDQNGDHKLQGTWGYQASYDDGGPWNASRSRRTHFQFLSSGGGRRSNEAPQGEAAPAQGEGTGETAAPAEETNDALGDL